MYCPNVGIVLRNPKGLVFVGKRVNEQFNYWQMPQGGIDEGENIEVAAKRELYEETGIQSASPVDVTDQLYSYDFPRPIRHQQTGEVQALGQKQKWVLMDFHGDEAEINLNAHTPEFEEHTWMTSS